MKAEAVLVMQRRESCKKRAPAETITILTCPKSSLISTDNIYSMSNKEEALTHDSSINLQKAG